MKDHTQEDSNQVLEFFCSEGAREPYWLLNYLTTFHETSNFYRSKAWLSILTGLLAKILKENNILQVQINAEHLRKRYKRVLYKKKKNADGHNKRISFYFETF